MSVDCGDDDGQSRAVVLWLGGYKVVCYPPYVTWERICDRSEASQSSHTTRYCRLGYGAVIF